ncbi:unnamed protein product [Echinostoma caproni]|uniref:Cleavage stimulation factor 50 kDa subunit n=1 Tax=Echinostoma caproni TaxID=27848 RepID=A0A183ASB3_9TREM|nr:unnamed protein product [Echinostoma caproni]
MVRNSVSSAEFVDEGERYITLIKPISCCLSRTLHHIRLYDVQTCRCYVSAVPEDQHQSAVNMVRWSPNGNAYVTAGMDGSFKIWDGVSCRCVNTFEAAHDGAPVCSVMFSRNGKVIKCEEDRSSGKDSAVKLWELATGRCLITYTGAGTTGHQTHRSMAVFNHTEDYVLFPDEATKSLCCWDSRNADRQRLLALTEAIAIQTLDPPMQTKTDHSVLSLAMTSDEENQLTPGNGLTTATVAPFAKKKSAFPRWRRSPSPGPADCSCKHEQVYDHHTEI